MLLLSGPNIRQNINTSDLSSVWLACKMKTNEQKERGITQLK
jgi:hypothetical protein